MERHILRPSIKHAGIHHLLQHIVIDLIDLILHLFLCGHLCSLHHTVRDLRRIILCPHLKIRICICKKRNRLHRNRDLICAILLPHRLIYRIACLLRNRPDQLPVLWLQVLRHVRRLESLHRRIQIILEYLLRLLLGNTGNFHI